MSTYSKDLRNLKRVSTVTDSQRVSEDLCIKQEREQKEIEERIAECTCYVDSSRVSYQSLINDIHQSEIVFKTVENVMAQALI